MRSFPNSVLSYIFLVIAVPADHSMVVGTMALVETRYT